MVVRRSSRDVLAMLTIDAARMVCPAARRLRPRERSPVATSRHARWAL